jgi:hypothetical protein
MPILIGIVVLAEGPGGFRIRAVADGGRRILSGYMSFA